MLPTAKDHLGTTPSPLAEESAETTTRTMGGAPGGLSAEKPQIAPDASVHAQAAPTPASPIPVAPLFGERLARAASVFERLAEEEARAQILAQETERERQQMGPLITRFSLARALQEAVPIFQSLGMKMSVVDASNGDRDAVLEVQRVCPYAAKARELNIARPCALTCEIDIAAVERAFPGIAGRKLAAQADGDALCIFKYERARTPEAPWAQAASSPAPVTTRGPSTAA